MKRTALRIGVTLTFLALGALLSQVALASYAEETLTVLERKASVPGAEVVATYVSPELDWAESRDLVTSDGEATELLRGAYAARTSVAVIVRLHLTAAEEMPLDWSAVRLTLENGPELEPLPYSRYGLPWSVASNRPVTADLAFPFTPVGPGNPPQEIHLFLHSLLPTSQDASFSWVAPLGLPRAAMIGVFEADVYAVRPDSSGGEDASQSDCH